MKQLFQSLETGKTEILDLPIPELKPRNILIRTRLSLISAGTERMIVDFGKSSLIEKVKQQPDKVSEVINKVKSEGPIETFNAVKNKLEKPIPLGYSNVGEIIEVGEKVLGFKVGDRVLSNGPHSEIVSVPHNLVSKIPDQVDDQEAVFTVIASVGLQGIRLANPTLGEVFLVNGLGLIGLLTSQLLLENGLRVLGIDPDKERCELAKSFGVEVLQLTSSADPISWCKNKTSGNNVDAVIITASTKSNEPIDLSARVCRKRGRIILVGSTGLNLKRDLFYKKELTFQVSCSYGPGRYEKSYEENGIDYPIGFIRWTEQRNFQAILNILERGKIETKNLVSHYFDFIKASKAYEMLLNDKKTLGIILKFNPEKVDLSKTQTLSFKKDSRKKLNTKPVIALIGAGNYSSRVLLPALKRAKANVNIIGALSGQNSIFLAKKFGIKKVTTDLDSLINDPSCNTLVIATRHDSHAKLVIKGLKAGKNIFVEKPICLTLDELINIKNLYNGKNILTVGYNRRFSPLIKILKKKLDFKKGPKTFIYTCNAGYISKDHWTQDLEIGGGRLIGECCHFLDLIRFLAGSQIVDFKLTKVPDNFINSDSFTFTFSFLDGSIGTIHYFTNGHKSFPKERVEVFASGTIFRIDNFKKLESWGEGNLMSTRKFNSKGQFECVSKFLDLIEFGGSDLIDFEEIFEVQKILLEALDK